MDATPNPARRAVLVVAHGSRSRRWVAAQHAWFAGVRARLEELGHPKAPVFFCFLEISEPLLEEELRALDGTAEEISILPFFLSKSGHVGEEIPEIAETILQKSSHRLLNTSEKDALLGQNAERRLAAAGAQPGLPVVVSGYGSSAHMEQWEALTEKVREHSGRYAEAPWLFAAAGHFLEDYAEPLRHALAEVQAQGHQRAAILPLYLSVSSYQETLIPGVIEETSGLEINFAPDSILPDEAMEQWAAHRIAQELQRDTPNCC